jgi:hypothetical protein
MCVCKWSPKTVSLILVYRQTSPCINNFGHSVSLQHFFRHPYIHVYTLASPSRALALLSTHTGFVSVFNNNNMNITLSILATMSRSIYPLEVYYAPYMHVYAHIHSTGSHLGFIHDLPTSLHDGACFDVVWQRDPLESPPFDPAESQDQVRSEREVKPGNPPPVDLKKNLETQKTYVHIVCSDIKIRHRDVPLFGHRRLSGLAKWLFS